MEYCTGGFYCSWDAVVDVAAVAENVEAVVVDVVAAATAAVADVVAADMVSAAAVAAAVVVVVAVNSMEAHYCKILIQFDIVAVAADSMPAMG